MKPMKAIENAALDASQAIIRFFMAAPAYDRNAANSSSGRSTMVM
jgi:hypothetical protein